MSPLRRRGGLQFEVVANLFVVVLAGLAIVAAVMGALAARTVERAALDQLRIEAHHLERIRWVGELRLGDLAALARTLPPRASEAHWTVFDSSGRQVGRSPGDASLAPELAPLVRDALARGDIVRHGSVFSSDLILVVPLVGAQPGVLVGAVPRRALQRQLDPLLRSGGWVLATAATIFVAFGAYLMRWRIVAPIRSLSAATRRIADGDLAARADTAGSDEIAELGSAFNHMAESLARERDALLRTRESLERSERLASVGQLAAGVAHEVGNPVAAILGYSEVALRDPELSTRSRDAAERVRSEALRIRELVRELLDLAASQRLELRACGPGQLVARVVSRVERQPLLAGVEISVEVAEGLPPLHTDPQRVEQILINLVENAAHALAGQRDGRIEIGAALAHARRHPGRRRDDLRESDLRAQRRADSVALSVVDNGPGVDAENQSRVFDPFFTTKDPGKGTGLGLWNAHRLAELMGGRIELESAPGRTCFSLLLPLADTDSEPEEADG